MTRIQRRSRKCSQEKDSASALDSGRASSFEFSVTSEEGINLVVDLNSSLVDWHKRLENSVCICQCLEQKKFQSFREELLFLGNSLKQTKNSFVSKSNSRTKDGDASITSSVNSFNKETDNSLLNHPDAKKGPSEIFAVEACSFAQEESEHLEQQRVCPVSISYISGVKEMNPSPRPEELKSMDPNAFHIPQGNIASCSTASLVLDGPQTTLHDKNMKLSDELSMNLKIKNSRDPVDAMRVLGSSVITVTESKFSEVVCLENDTASSSFVNNPLLSLTDSAPSMEAGLGERTNSVEIETHAHLNILFAEEQASGSPINRPKASCSKKQKETEKFMSDGGRKRKRHNSQFDKVSVQLSGRVLRSAVRPRRSRRLVPKGVARL